MQVTLTTNITAGDGVGSITSVSLLNVKPTVAFTHSTGAVGEASGDPISIQMSNNGAAVIPAQTISGGLLSIVTDVGTATYSVTSKEFEAGREYTINLAVKLTDVGATSAITDWTTTVLTATADHKGWIITADGSIYPNKAAVEAVGKTGVAMIFFVGDKGRAEHNYRGLAISLVKSTTKFSWGYHGDHPEEKCIRSWYTDFAHAVTDLYGLENTLALRSHGCHNAVNEVMDNPNNYGVIPAGTVGWFMGAVEQWKLFFDYCGVTWEQKGGNNFGTPTDDVNVSEKVAAAFAASGYEISNIGRYWSSTQGTYASGPRAWRINISDNRIDIKDAAYAYFGQSYRTIKSGAVQIKPDMSISLKEHMDKNINNPEFLKVLKNEDGSFKSPKQIAADVKDKNNMNRLVTESYKKVNPNADKNKDLNAEKANKAKTNSNVNNKKSVIKK